MKTRLDFGLINRFSPRIEAEQAQSSSISIPSQKDFPDLGEGNEFDMREGIDFFIRFDFPGRLETRLPLENC
jgi:hypothetical protein